MATDGEKNGAIVLYKALKELYIKLKVWERFTQGLGKIYTIFPANSRDIFLLFLSYNDLLVFSNSLLSSDEVYWYC